LAVRLAASATLVVLLVVAAVAATGLLEFSYLGSTRSTSTSTTTTTQISTQTLAVTSTQTVTQTSAVTTSSPASSGRLYQVTFKELVTCDGFSYIHPWGVVLGDASIVEPSNSTISEIPEATARADNHFNLTTIVFGVPSGTYNFTLYPTHWLGWMLNSTNPFLATSPQGNVTVTTSDVTIYAQPLTVRPGC
jgi:hypothetical protein